LEYCKLVLSHLKCFKTKSNIESTRSRVMIQLMKIAMKQSLNRLNNQVTYVINSQFKRLNIHVRTRSRNTLYTSIQDTFIPSMSQLINVISNKNKQDYILIWKPKINIMKYKTKTRWTNFKSMYIYMIIINSIYSNY